MQKHIIGFAIAAAAFGVSAPAFAEFGRAGDVSFAADRLMGMYLVDNDPGDDDFTVGLGASPVVGLPYTLSRLGIDFLIIDGLSLGGNLALWFGDTSFRDDDVGVLFHPRVGYAYAFNDSFGIWPRGGLTYWSWGEDNDEFALTAEAMFFATPGDHWGFLFGPTLDIGLAGDHRGDDEMLAFGIVSAGIFAWF